MRRLQVQIRGHLARKRLRERRAARKKLLHDSAVTIQCAFRCYQARVRVSELRERRRLKRRQAATTIQT